VKERRRIPGIGERFLMIRTIFSKTQEEMSFMVNSEGWSGYELEKTTPGASVIGELCLLGINANWLLTGTGPLLRNDIPACENPSVKEVISPAKEIAKRLSLCGLTDIEINKLLFGTL